MLVKFFLWLFIIHITYEIGYFMNDYFASDSLDNWRSPDYLSQNEKKYYLMVKLSIVFLFNITTTIKTNTHNNSK